MKTILVPLDGSAFAEHALPLALGLAEASGARVRLVTVHASPVAGFREIVWDSHFQTTLADVEQVYLSEVVRRVGTVASAAVDSRILMGETTQALLAFVADGIDLVVMSTHGRGGFRRAWLGSVADVLVRHLEAAPLLLVRPQPPEDRPADLHPARVRRVLLALDGSAAAEGVLPAAAEICALHDAECVLLRVVVPPLPPVAASVPDTAYYPYEVVDARRREAERYLAMVAGRLPEVHRQEVIVDHQPARAILRLADEIGADLIAVGTRGAGAVGRMLMGSTADKVVRGASIPVLVRHHEVATTRPDATPLKRPAAVTPDG